jgi:hypothetical protein
MRQFRSPGSVEGVMGNHDSYSDRFEVNRFGLRRFDDLKLACNPLSPVLTRIAIGVS